MRCALQTVDSQLPQGADTGHSDSRSSQPVPHGMRTLRSSCARVRTGSPQTTASTGTSSAPVDGPQPCAPLSCMELDSAAAAAVFIESSGLDPYAYWSFERA